MTTPTGAAVRAHYGFGLEQHELAGHEMITHNGGIPGFASSNAWFSNDKLAVVVLANSAAAKVDALLAQVARATLGSPLLEPHKRVAVSAEQLARYAGVYALTLGETTRDFTVSVATEHFTCRSPVRAPIRSSRTVTTASARPLIQK